jgi:hypothetical protein
VLPGRGRSFVGRRSSLPREARRAPTDTRATGRAVDAASTRSSADARRGHVRGRISA